jgi:hypothetical protein
MEGSHRRQRGLGRITIDTASCSEQQSGAEQFERDAAMEKVGGEASIGVTETAVGVRELEIKGTDGANVEVCGHGFFLRRAAISISLSRTR